jgi:RNA 3'-terminal phosphate cyclase (ATP)
VNFRRPDVLLKDMSASLIEIDGSFGEGGGQILRTSLALSLITAKPFRLKNIRAGRAKPGLQPQHLMCVRAAATIGQATTRGACPGSSELTFEPGEVVAGKYHFPIGTAGATSLVLHTLYLPLAFRATVPSELTITGGTHVEHSPAFHFLQTTWRGYLELFGLHVGLKMRRPGFYPRGGGVLEAVVQPCARVQPLRLDDVKPATAVSIMSASAGLPETVNTRQSRRASFRLRETGLAVDVEQETWEGGPGSMLAIKLETPPVPTLFFGLGARGKPSERVADEAADQALAHLRTEPPGVDLHTGDQLVLPLALAEGSSAYRVTEVTRHLLTNIEVIQRFVERNIRVDGAEGYPGVVRVDSQAQGHC